MARPDPRRERCGTGCGAVLVLGVALVILGLALLYLGAHYR